MALPDNVRDREYRNFQEDGDGEPSRRVIIKGAPDIQDALADIEAKFFSDTATLSNVVGSASSVTLLALNTSRKGFIFYNDSNRDCYIKFGTTASTISFTVFMAAGSTFIPPFPVYRGIIDAIWTGANGNMRITELT